MFFEHGHLTRAELSRHICPLFQLAPLWGNRTVWRRLVLKIVGAVGELTPVTPLTLLVGSSSSSNRQLGAGAVQKCPDRQCHVVHMGVPLHSRHDSRNWMSEAHNHMPSSMFQQP